MSDVDYSKLKVTELREELKKHGLETKGKKEQLIKRLENFSNGSADASLGEGDAALSQDDAGESQTEESQEVADTPAEQPEPVVEPEPAAEPEPPVEPEPMATEESAEPEAAEAESAEPAAEPMESEAVPEEGGEDKPTAEVETAESETVEAEKTEGGEKRKRSKSPEHKSRHGDDSPSHKRERREEAPKVDDLAWVESEDVQLDRYNCDLNVEVVNQGFTIKPQSFGGFGYMWGGVRANYGVASGKVAFQMKTVKNLRIQIGEESLGANHVSRVGWSIDGLDYQLGEYPKSWGYGGTGKLSTCKVFTDFGSKYYNGDVVTCYLDMTGDDVVMYFARNEQPMEKAAEFPKSDLEDAALYPAFATKNQIIEVNFGQLEKAWYPLLGEGEADSEYTFISKVGVEDRVRSAKPPMSKEESEVLLLIGLPGAGKSHWAAQTQKEQPEKRFYVLGTNNIIDKMRVEGMPRKNNYQGRWDVLFDQANDCLRRMLETATRRFRNYILDQTNVYDTAQRRKMRPFVGFKRKAVVVLPTDKVFRERIEKRTKEEGKEVPETAVLEMKANFSVPTAPIEIALNPEANEIAAREEVERLAKEEEERLAKEEADRVAKEEADRVAKEKEEADRVAKEEADRVAKEKEEEKEAAKKAAAEKAAEEGTGEEETAVEGADKEEVDKEGETEGEEKAAADAAETEKTEEVKQEAEKMEETEPEPPAATEEPAADAVKEEPATDAVKEEPAAEAIASEEKETDGGEKKQENSVEAPATEESTEKAATEDSTEKAATEESTEKAATEDSTEKAATEDSTEKSAAATEGEVKEEKKEEPEQVFEEVLFTELSGDMARALLAVYVNEGQVKFPPGSRRFRREDRRIERGGSYKSNDYRQNDNRDRRDGGYNNRGGGNNSGNRYGSSGGYNQSRGYDNRNRYDSRGGSYNNKGGGYRSGGSYGNSYGGGGWGNQGGWGGGQSGWGGQGSWGGQGGWGNQRSWGGWGSGGYGSGGQGGYGQGYGGSQGYGSQGGYGGSGSGSNWGGSGSSGSSWNQGGYGSGYGGYSGGGY